jgi:hypothetical protein
MLPLALGFWIVPAESRILGRNELFGLLVVCGCVFLLGVYDDVRGANAPRKLTFQTAGAVLLYFSGVRILEVSTPFGRMITLGVSALPFTARWLVAPTNGMNLLDGADVLPTDRRDTLLSPFCSLLHHANTTEPKHCSCTAPTARRGHPAQSAQRDNALIFYGSGDCGTKTVDDLF